MTNTVFLVLGSNLGNRQKNLDQAIEEIGNTCGIVARCSSVYETEPWGVIHQPDYYNQVVEIFTSLDAETLMKTLLEIEKKLGRIRTEKYNARTIDIDILFFNHEIIENEIVIIPHQRLHERRFVLEPICELAPDFIHPVLKKNMAELLQTCSDKMTSKKI
jgi:2-amino-4-hydroxy-6-hydroxymethyldihydropteridine diphosphokinase